MPKLVDPATRRREVVDAVFRVAIRDGLQQASLRKVADEARLNIGSVRHYFAGHRELMLFAMHSMIDRVSERLTDHLDAVPDPSELTPGERGAVTAEVLEELLPLDERRRAEVTVWLEFTTAARTDPALGESAGAALTGSQTVVGRILTRQAADGALRPGLDLDTEIVRLAALIDGLCLTAVVQPDALTPDQCRAALRTHLAGLAG